MKEKLIPILSIAIGFIAFVLTLQYWKGKREEIEKERMALLKAMETLPVVVAYRDIPQGAKIAQNDLTEKTIPKPRIPKDAVYRADALKILGKKSLFQINKDEPISWSSIEGGSPDAYGLAPMITHRMRAVSLPVSGSAAVSSMVRPNDRIDVLGTFSFPSKKTQGEMETATLTILQDVTVLATGQQTANQLAARTGQQMRGTPTYNSVTLQVTPKEAELLVFAQQAKGQIFLALRNPDDASFESDLPAVNFDHLQNKLQEYNNYRQSEIHRKGNRSK